MKSQVPLNGLSLFYTKTQKPCQSFETKPLDSSSLCLCVLHEKEPGEREKEGDKECGFLFLVTIVFVFSDLSKMST